MKIVLAIAKLMEVLHNTCGLSDCGCTLRLVNRQTLDEIADRFTVTGSHFLPEMVILARKQQARIIEIPVNYRERHGSSKITGSLRGILSTGLNMIWLIIRYRFIR